MVCILAFVDMTPQSGRLLPQFWNRNQPTNQITLCHNREYQNMNLHCHDTLKLYIQQNPDFTFSREPPKNGVKSG